MRNVLIASFLLVGLAACGGGGEEAPPPQPAMAAPPPAAAPPPMPAGFEGHYVGSAAAGHGRTCAREENYDFTVANNQVTGTVSGPGGRSMQLTGKIDANGHAALQEGPHGGRVTGQFSSGTFTGRTGRPCSREVTASIAH